jgi:hypothetical protein
VQAGSLHGDLSTFKTGLTLQADSCGKYKNKGKLVYEIIQHPGISFSYLTFGIHDYILC